MRLNINTHRIPSGRCLTFAFLSLAEEGNSSCQNVQHNILASVNFLNIFLSKFLTDALSRFNSQEFWHLVRNLSLFPRWYPQTSGRLDISGLEKQCTCSSAAVAPRFLPQSCSPFCCFFWLQSPMQLSIPH